MTDAPSPGTPEHQEEVAVQEAAAASRDDARNQIERLVRSPHRALVLRSLDRHLAPAVDERSYDRLEAALSPFLDSAGVLMLALAATRDADDDPGSVMSPDALSFMNEVAALYGPRLNEALHTAPAFRQQGQDWSTVSRRVVRNVVTGDYEFTVRIGKRNGETLTIEAPAGSFLRLTQRFVRLLRRTEDPTAYEADDLASLFAEVDAFREFIGQQSSESDISSSATSRDSERRP